jgi:hypothetical protein
MEFQRFDEYEADKKNVSHKKGDNYQVPKWYGLTFLWLWPFFIIGYEIFIGLKLQRAPQFTEAAAWWIGLMCFTWAFSAFFQYIGRRN